MIDLTWYFARPYASQSVNRRYLVFDDVTLFNACSEGTGSIWARRMHQAIYVTWYALILPSKENANFTSSHVQNLMEDLIPGLYELILLRVKMDPVPAIRSILMLSTV